LQTTIRLVSDSFHCNPLQYLDGLDTDHQSMIRRLQFRIRKLIAAFLLAFAITPELRAAERGLEKVRIAVSSKSLGFLDTWAAKE